MPKFEESVMGNNAATFRFNRMELAGSLGDLGTLLPIAIAMVMLNGIDPVGLFFSVGLFYIIAGVYFGTTVPVQPMKVIGAYAIGTSLSATEIMASTFLMGLLLLIVGGTGAIETVRKYTPKTVIRGVQLATGTLLISGGIKFIMGSSKFQLLQGAGEPYLALQSLGPIPMGIIIGLIGGIVTLLLLDNRRFPAGLMVVAGGLLLGLVLGARIDIDNTGSLFGFHLPQLFPFPFPDRIDFSFALIGLVLPQLPMTLGNAVMAYTDLSKEYFGEKASRLSNRKVCISMGLANMMSFCLGGMPLCHGAGGLAAHYRFGARTAGSNVMIGLIFLLLTVLFGENIIAFFNLMPMAVLGILLVFAGAQLALSIMDLNTRKEFFVVIIMLGITLASNLALGFLVGVVLAQLLKSEKLTV